MIDVTATRAALLKPLVQFAPAGRIAEKGKPFTPPKGDVPHYRPTVTWEYQGKVGPSLWIGSGMLQVLAFAPFGIGEEALLAEAKKIAALYEPHVDGAPLDYGVRVLQVAVMDAVEMDGRATASAAAPAQWIAAPVQVDFSLERTAA